MPLQLMDHEVLEEARGRQVAVPLDSDGREQLLDDVLAELRHLYGNVNTLFIHADKQVASHSHINSMGAFHCVCRCAHAHFVPTGSLCVRQAGGSAPLVEPAGNTSRPSYNPMRVCITAHGGAARGHRPPANAAQL